MFGNLADSRRRTAGALYLRDLRELTDLSELMSLRNDGKR